MKTLVEDTTIKGAYSPYKRPSMYKWKNVLESAEMHMCTCPKCGFDSIIESKQVCSNCNAPINNQIPLLLKYNAPIFDIENNDFSSQMKIMSEVVEKQYVSVGSYLIVNSDMLFDVNDNGIIFPVIMISAKKGINNNLDFQVEALCDSGIYIYLQSDLQYNKKIEKGKHINLSLSEDFVISRFPLTKSQKVIVINNQKWLA